MLLLALVVLNALAWSGILVDEEASNPRRKAPPPAATPPAPADVKEAAPTPERPTGETIARKNPAKPHKTGKRGATTMVVSATRGDCWVEVRAGSATGETLYEGTLAAGSSLRFSRPKIWLRLGAASHVDVVVNGRPSAVPPGTVELTVPDA